MYFCCSKKNFGLMKYVDFLNGGMKRGRLMKFFLVGFLRLMRRLMMSP